MENLTVIPIQDFQENWIKTSEEKLLILDLRDLEKLVVFDGTEGSFLIEDPMKYFK